MTILYRAVKKAAAFAANFPRSHAAMRYIYWYALLLILCSMIYVAAWLWDWHAHLRANLEELRAFLHEISSAAWIAVAGFLAKSMIDRNQDGIPDSLEDEKKEGHEGGIRDVGRGGMMKRV